MAGRDWRRRLAIIAAALCLTAGSALAEEQFAVATVNQINLRSGPNAASALLGQYPEHTWMTVTGESGGWYAVIMPDGQAGYVGGRQVALPEAQLLNVGLVSHLTDSAYVNLRERAHYQAKVLATYHNGVPCLLMSHTGGWYHVRVNGVEGYLREEYVQPQVMAWAEETATVIVQGGASAALRSGPGEQYASVDMVQSGQYVLVIQKGVGWWYVSVGGQLGFMDEECLRAGILTYEEIADSRWAALTDAVAVVSNPSSKQMLNLRESPSTLGTVLGQYPSGVRLTLLNQGLEWCRVMNDAGEIGYMMTDYLILEGVPEIPLMTVDHPDGTFVNLRSAPSTLLGAIITQVPHGEQVTVLVPGSEWVKVRYGDETGYMAAGFLTE